MSVLVTGRRYRLAEILRFIDFNEEFTTIQKDGRMAIFRYHLDEDYRLLDSAGEERTKDWLSPSCEYAVTGSWYHSRDNIKERLYRKKPVVIEAIRYNGKNRRELRRFCLQELNVFVESESSTYLIISTLEGDMRVPEGDWIIKGVKGEFYACKNDIFQMTYEKEEQ